MLPQSLPIFMELLEDRYAALEAQYSVETLVSTIDALPEGVVDGSIARYQGIIRSNMWYFPTLQDVSLEMFVGRWIRVHENYFELAAEIFGNLLREGSISALATPDLLTQVIHSETMRGWVGKRSPSGLDALLAARITQLEALLEPFGDEGEDLLSYGGTYTGDPSRVSAEQHTLKLFVAHHAMTGRAATRNMLDHVFYPHIVQLLRSYCRYSLDQLNAKYNALTPQLARDLRPPANADALVQDLLAKLDPQTRTRVGDLLEEVKALNLLNLNYEVRYSFKGWAGLMHILVIIACSTATDVETDVYEMRNRLANGA